jgi:hypothetical protein
VDVQALLAKMAEQRAHWVDLPGTGTGTPPLRLQFHRPPEVELPQLAHGVMLDHLVQYACGWAGFTEAVLLGPAVGSADAVPFSRELWAAWLRDHSDAVPVVADALAKVVTKHLEQREAVAKNLPPSLT